MANEMSNDATAYYAGGFKRIIGGVPCKVFARRTTDGRWINAKDAPHYDALYDDPSNGISRLERDHEVLEQAQLALNERQARKPRKPHTRKKPPEVTVETQEPVSAVSVPSEPHIAPVDVPAAIPAPSGDILARLAAIEAAIGIASRPARTERHAAAIRRAWAMRQAMRAQADLDRRALIVAREYLDTVEAARAAAVHRAECDAARLVEMTAERDEALAMAEAEEARANAVARGNSISDARADRLARIATDQRRRLSHAQQDVARALTEARTARAGERKAISKLSEIRDAANASAVVTRIIDRAIAA